MEFSAVKHELQLHGHTSQISWDVTVQTDHHTNHLNTCARLG